MLTKTSYGLSIRKFKKIASIIAISISPITTAWAQCSAPSVPGTSICAGQLANLTPSPVVANTSYDWYSVPTGGTPIQTANSFTPQLSTTTTYYVAARTSTCTSARTAVTVNVNPLPADGFFTVSPTSICTGDAISFSNVINTGFTVTVSKPSTYTQIAGSCGSTSTSTGCSGTMSGTGTFSATATTSMGCQKVINQTVTVNPKPTVTLTFVENSGNGANICENTPLTLKASTVVGATYTFTGPNNFSSITTSPTVLVSNSAPVAMAGTYKVKATVNGCTSTEATLNIQIAKAPITPVPISTPQCFTPGTPVTYSFPTPANGGYYSWQLPAGFSIGNLGGTREIATITPAIGSTGGQITVVGYTAPYCPTKSYTFNVKPNPTVTLPASILGCNNSPLSITASTVVGATYTWTGPNNFTATTTTPTVVVSNSPTDVMKGTYTVKATLNGCTSPTVSTSVNEIFVNSGTPGIISSLCFNPGVANTQVYTSSAGLAYQTFVWTYPANFTKTWSSATGAGIRGTFASATPTQFSVYTTVSGCPNSPTYTFTMNPNPVPVITAAKDRMCKDETMQLVTSISGGTWSIVTSPLPPLTGGATTNSTISSTGLFTGNNPGVFTVRYTVTVNGCTGYSEKVMTVGALPFTITGPDKMCQNQNAVFFASQDQSGKNSQYQWDLYLRSNNTDVAIIGDVNNVPSTSNWDFDKITLSTRNQAVGSVLKIGAKGDFECIAGANRSLYASKLVTVVASPSTDKLMIICADGNCNQLTVVDKITRQPATGLTYQWTVANATTQTITNPKNTSTVSCTVTNADGCSVKLDWWTYSTWTCATGTVYNYDKAWYCNQNYTQTNCPNTGNLRKAEAQKYELEVYPNPSKDNITFLTEGLEGTASIYNIDGVVFKTLPINKDETMHNMNISTLQSGMYILRIVSSNGESHSAPFIKE